MFTTSLIVIGLFVLRVAVPLTVMLVIGESLRHWDVLHRIAT